MAILNYPGVTTTEIDNSRVVARPATSVPAGVIGTAGKGPAYVPLTFSSYSGFSNVVDIFHATAGTWSTAALSVARVGLAATSLPSAGLAFFAGGYCTCLLCLFELMRDAIVCEGGCVSGRRVLR